MHSSDRDTEQNKKREEKMMAATEMKSIARITHVYEDDIEALLHHLHGLNCDHHIEDGYVFIKKSDFEHAIEIIED